MKGKAAINTSKSICNKTLYNSFVNAVKDM
jgi:hypothetical protein